MLIFLFTLTSCSTQSPSKPRPSIENNNSILVIDLDKEIKPNTDLRGKDTLLIDTPIYVGDNDEVSFRGDIIKKNSPIQVKIGDNDEVAFTGKSYSIQSMELRNGDIIQMRGKSGNIFVEIEVLK
ncbi:MAG: Unknown protein [uncultured Sulfurovum sp.]|uniref:Uncharacterized protein n=1 Tax=uncultured Sulfurovum sp. TaxID=269237 RepID=A0A6S6TKF4_9BACT|nr:MAG: Unknown protein [uncultured Sulfurovum sp.]